MSPVRLYHNRGPDIRSTTKQLQEAAAGLTNYLTGTAQMQPAIERENR